MPTKSSLEEEILQNHYFAYQKAPSYMVGANCTLLFPNLQKGYLAYILDKIEGGKFIGSAIFDFSNFFKFPLLVPQLKPDSKMVAFFEKLGLNSASVGLPSTSCCP